MQMQRPSSFSIYTKISGGIVLAILAMLVSIYGVYHFIYRQKCKSVLASSIQTIIQEPTFSLDGGAVLPTTFLVEELHLSTDHPMSIDHFDIKQGETHLLATHIIHKVSIKKMQPHTL